MNFAKLTFLSKAHILKSIFPFSSLFPSMKDFDDSRRCQGPIQTDRSQFLLDFFSHRMVSILVVLMQYNILLLTYLYLIKHAVYKHVKLPTRFDDDMDNGGDDDFEEPDENLVNCSFFTSSLTIYYWICLFIIYFFLTFKLVFEFL